MGKVRARNRKSRGRPRPTGLPSVRETIQQQHLQPAGSQRTAILDKLSHVSYEEREWACRSLSHLILEEASLKRLMKARLVRKTTPLMLDQVVTVREAAAGLLRNLSAMGNEHLCDDLVKEDIMTPLSAMIRDCLAKLDQIHKKSDVDVDKVMEGAPATEGSKKSASTAKAKHRQRLKADIEEQQLCEVLEQGLHLLWNVSERSQLVVEVFNREALLPVILSILQPSLHSDRLVLLAAQLLQTVSEDNFPAVQEICSSPQHLSQLESLLQEAPPSDKPNAKSSQLLVRTCIAGVFQNLLPSLPDPVQSQTLRGVLALLSNILDIDIPTLVSTTKPPESTSSSGDTATDASSDNPTVSGESEASKPTSSKVKSSVKPGDLVKSVETTLSAVQQALEILANISYVEADDDDDWEDTDDMEEVIGEGGGQDVADMETDTQQQAPNGHRECDADLLVITELGIHEKVWKLSCVDIAGCQQECEPNLQRSLSLVQSRSLIALQNLLTVLPLERWGSGRGDGCGLATIWTSLFAHCNQCCDVIALTGVLLVVAEKMSESEASCVTLDQVRLLSPVGLTFELASVRATVMSMLGRLGRLTLSRQEEGGADILQIIGTTLRDSISNDVSLWIVSQALDSIFDLFGDDNCPPSLCVSLSLLPALRQVSSSFKARFRVERRNLGDQLGLVQNAQANLPRFITYMNTRCQT